jgi:two-component system NtrC family sensor kinase
MSGETRGPHPLNAGGAALRMLLDSTPARVALLDRHRRHWYVNQDYAQFVGRPAEEILGRTVQELIGEDAFAELRPFGLRALAGEAVEWEGWMPHHITKEALFVQRFYVPYRTGDGSIDGYFVLTRDLTELKRTEQRLAEQVKALHASQALATAVTGSALDCIIVVDEAGDVVSFNPAAEATFGYRAADTIGQPIARLIVPPDQRAAHAESMRRYRATGEARWLRQRVEMQAMRADGTRFPAELAISEVRLPERRLLAAWLRDLTSRKEAEAEIRRQRDALHESEKFAAFGSLLAGVAHELNNPLSIVIGHAVLLEEEANETGHAGLMDRAERIRLAAERCGQTISTFLSMARQRGIHREPVDVDALLDSAIGPLNDKSLQEDIELVREVPAGISAVLGDPNQLRHVIANLVVNARQALRNSRPPRRIRIAAREVGTVVEIAVHDNGPGVLREIRGRIFDPFFTTKKPGAGTGIGLSVSRGIAVAHGGTLLLAPSTRGARFVLRLPLADVQSATTETSRRQVGHKREMKAR